MTTGTGARTALNTPCASTQRCRDRYGDQGHTSAPNAKQKKTTTTAQHKELQTLKRSRAGLAISDTVVMNQRRNTSGTRVGIFTGIRGGAFTGTGTSFSESTSSTYGDLVFILNGKEFFRFVGISDPYGLRRLIEAIKKQKKV
jgi:hypothetical protein